MADSPLVKTAIHGADPNWGRIVSAAGYAGIPFAEEELSLWINDVAVYEAGTPTDFDAAALSASLRGNRDVNLRLLFRRGAESDPLLDLRPHRRVRPAQRRLHDLTGVLESSSLRAWAGIKSCGSRPGTGLVLEAAPLIRVRGTAARDSVQQAKKKVAVLGGPHATLFRDGPAESSSRPIC